MRSFVLKLGRKGRKRRRKERDHKTMLLTDAGIRLLALKDYDALSMAKIARTAGVSVGALYARYPDKSAYLYHLIADAFRNMRDGARLVLNESRWRRQSASFVVKQIVGHVVTKMCEPRAAGVIRATIKLATVKPITMELYEEYRAEVAELSVELLAPKLRTASPRMVRVAMQIVLGTVTDAILQKKAGPMNAGSARMTEALTNIFLGYLGLSSGGSWAGEEAEGEDEIDESANLIPETEIDESEARARVYDPDLRAYGSRLAKPMEMQPRRKRGGGKPVLKAEMVNPARVPKPPQDKPQTEPRKRRRIFI